MEDAEPDHKTRNALIAEIMKLITKMSLAQLKHLLDEAAIILRFSPRE